MRRLIAVVAAVVGAAAFSAPVAGAATFCVHQPAGCAGTAEPTIQQALDAAAALDGRDRVEVGTGGTGHAEEPMSIAPGNAVDVVGVGGPVLVLTGTRVATVREPSAVVHGLTVLGYGGAGPLVDLQAGTWEDSTLQFLGVGTGLRLGDATARRVDVSGAQLGVAVEAAGPGGVLEDAFVQGTVGLLAHADGLALRRAQIASRNDANATAAARVTGGTLTADDSAFVSIDPFAGSIGLDVAASGGAAVGVTLRSVTVAGRAGPTTSGLRARCDGGAAEVAAVDTVMTGFGLDLERGGAGCAVHLDHVRYGTRDAFGGAFDDVADVLSAPLGPLSVTGAPGGGSPLVDTGSARPLAAGETDADGRPRIVDGDADGTPRRDIGAYEYQRRPPTVTIAGPAVARAGEAAGFEAVAGDPDAGDALTYAWTVDGAPAAPGELGGLGATLVHAFAAAGDHRVGVTVTDSAGLSAASTLTVTVSGRAGATVTGSGTTSDPTPGGDVPAPVVAPSALPPDLTFAGGRVRLGRRGLPVLARCNRTVACAGALEVRRFSTRARGSLVGRAGRFRLAAGASGVVFVPVSARVRRGLRRLRSVDLEVRAVRAGRTWALGAVTLRR